MSAIQPFLAAFEPSEREQVASLFEDVVCRSQETPAAKVEAVRTLCCSRFTFEGPDREFYRRVLAVLAAMPDAAVEYASRLCKGDAP